VYLDKPDLLAAALPDFVLLGPGIWTPTAPVGFLSAVISAMGVGEILTGEREGRSGGGAGGFWSDLVLVADSPCSQYDALRQALTAEGPPPRNLACVALSGSGFHGQHGRPWSTAPGNLHLSAIIACDLSAADFAPVMPALPAVAVAEAVTTLGQGRLSPGIKWVNDVLLRDHKVAGGLTAVRTDRGRITAVVLGVGLNVAVAPDLPADSAGLRSTSLRAVLLDRTPGLDQTLTAVLAALARRFVRLQESGSADLLRAYRDLSVVLGRRVLVQPEQGPGVTAEVVAIEPDLSLRLQGVAAPVTAGQLTLLGPGT